MGVSIARISRLMDIADWGISDMDLLNIKNDTTVEEKI
jgi:hypothetical protein